MAGSMFLKPKRGQNIAGAFALKIFITAIANVI